MTVWRTADVRAEPATSSLCEPGRRAPRTTMMGRSVADRLRAALRAARRLSAEMRAIIIAWCLPPAPTRGAAFSSRATGVDGRRQKWRVNGRWSRLPLTARSISERVRPMSWSSRSLIACS